MTRPHVICHMMSPLDGRLKVDGWAPSDSPLNKVFIGEYERLHAQFDCDAWLAGTNTMEEFANGKAPADASAAKPSDPPARPWRLADESAKKFAIALDRHGRLHWDSPTADEAHVVVVLGSAVPDAHLAELTRSGVSYLVMPAEAIDLKALLAALVERLPIRSLLVEGGGTTSGAFVKAGLVDEISLLLCPAIDGTAGAQTVFEAGDDGIGTRARLELLSAQPGAGGTCHLRYRVAY